MDKEIQGTENNETPIELEVEIGGGGDEGFAGSDDDAPQDDNSGGDDNDLRARRESKNKLRAEKRRKAIQREADKKRDYEAKIALLEQEVAIANQRFSTTESRINQYEKKLIGDEITNKQAELDFYQQKLAEAIGSNDGTLAAQATEAMRQANEHIAELKARQKSFVEQPNQQNDVQREMWERRNRERANNWVNSNDWFNDPDYSSEKKIALSVNNQILREGVYDPATPEFYEELEFRLKQDKRTSHLFDDEQDVSKPQYTRTTERKPTTSRTTGAMAPTASSKKIVLHPSRDAHIIDAWRSVGILDDAGKIIKGQEARAKKYYDETMRIRNGK